MLATKVIFNRRSYERQVKARQDMDVCGRIEWSKDIKEIWISLGGGRGGGRDGERNTMRRNESDSQR